MARPIPIALEHAPEIEIDAALVAERLDLPLARFRQLMDDRKITQLCERGTGPDKGLFRASFYYKGRRVRLVVDAEGSLVAPVQASTRDG